MSLRTKDTTRKFTKGALMAKRRKMFNFASWQRCANRNNRRHHLPTMAAAVLEEERPSGARGSVPHRLAGLSLKGPSFAEVHSAELRAQPPTQQHLCQGRVLRK